MAKTQAFVHPPPGARLRQYVKRALGKCYVIPVARVCNASCYFCATDVYRPDVSSEMLAVSSKLVDQVKFLAAAGVSRFEITGGGEPTLHPELDAIVSSIRTVPGAHIKLYTNGGRLPGGMTIDELNISRCAIEPGANQQLMRIRTGTLTLDELIRQARAKGFTRIRLSVPLIKGGVRSLRDAVDFVDNAAGLVEAVVFRPLYPATPERGSLDPDCEVTGWEEELRRLESVRRSSMDIEVDVDGCFRASQLILASDLRLYTEWTLRTPAPL